MKERAENRSETAEKTPKSAAETAPESAAEKENPPPRSEAAAAAGSGLEREASERNAVRTQVKSTLESGGMDGIAKALARLQAVTRSDWAAAVYLSDPDIHDRPPREWSVETAHAADGSPAPPPPRSYALHEGLGGNLIAYSGEAVDSNLALQALGIVKSADETPPRCQTISLEDRTRAPIRTIGKLYLAGCPPLSAGDADLADSVAMQIETQIVHYLAEKRLLAQSIGSARADLLARRPYARRWALGELREAEVAVARCSLKNFAEAASIAGPEAARAAREWIDGERELAVDLGGYFDAESGGSVTALFGPPLYEIGIEQLSDSSSADDLDALMEALPPNAERYAFQAVQFALASIDAFADLAVEGERLELSIGIEAGAAAVGDFTGSGRELSAVGSASAHAAQLQDLAGAGRVAVGPSCRQLLEGYRRLTLDDSLPFEVREAGNAHLKGHDEPAAYYSARRIQQKG